MKKQPVLQLLEAVSRKADPQDTKNVSKYKCSIVKIKKDVFQVFDCITLERGQNGKEILSSLLDTLYSQVNPIYQLVSHRQSLL